MLCVLIAAAVRIAKYKGGEPKPTLSTVAYCVLMVPVGAFAMSICGNIARKYGELNGSTREGKDYLALMCAAVTVGVVMFAVGLYKILIRAGTGEKAPRKAVIQLTVGIVLLAVSGALTVYFGMNI